MNTSKYREQNMNIINIYTGLLFSPQQAFAQALRLKVVTLFFPLAAALVITALLNTYYYAAVDMPWLLERMVADIPDDQKQTVLDSLSKGRLLGISLVGVVFLTVSINLFRAFIYWFVLKVKGEAQRFIRLFAIVMWSTAPLLLILPAGVLNIYLSTGQGMLPNDVNPVSLNQLFFKLSGDSDWGQLLSTFSLINIWEIFLIIIGLKLATSLSIKQSFTIALLPELVIYGLWVTSLLL